MNKKICIIVTLSAYNHKNRKQNLNHIEWSEKTIIHI